ncbi:MAG: CDP-glycerol glycerophosphotransferase family protein [Methanobrevibacter sp.]|uniref:CDP-glycerol glycerophosphotransferase family protein n=1 Tax=Methanobrevibacter sp. TaxID=66852 RepID=UPI0025D31F8C|nr:CDP-glycerol glycerophosphotransferase family protein [Methanobrevibacter sp.]MBR6993878.1 CDP-glycerol glycerophosphotransferase family protein [Methanobrevibacter sp.]
MGFIDKFRNLNECKTNSAIYDAYYNSRIEDDMVYIESRNGFDFTGNLFRIVEELSTGKYGNFRIYVYAESHVNAKIEEYGKNYGLNIHEVINSKDKACEIMHKAKYVFTDSGIRNKYVKKQGQIFINTWHGTILKLMGIDNSHERLTMGIIQRSLLFSDYLIFPSNYLKERLLKSFMLEDVYPGKILLEGYPRNSVFLDESRSMEFKSKFGLENHEIFIYMPTFKGLVDNRKDEKQKGEVSEFLKEIDESLNDNQVLFAKLHPYNTQKIDFDRFTHIRPFPKGFEIYDIVNMADCLITDYSSVFFDFANTRRKIIIFNYDEEEYLSDRGFYFPLSDLPFPKVQTVRDLITEMNLPKDYDDTQFVEKFCQYERPDAVEYICDTIFNGMDSCRFETVDNGRPNVLLFAGDFTDNDSVDNMIEYIESINPERYNVFVTFCSWKENIRQNHESVFNRIPEGVGVLPFANNLFPTIKEKLEYNKLYKGSEECYDDSMKSFFKRTFDLQFGNLDFEYIVSFDSSDFNQNLTFDSACDNFYLLSDSNSKVEKIIGRDSAASNLKDLPLLD